MLICEFMADGTLAGRLDKGPLAIAEALDLGIALAEALRVIHGAGLLHRDIKPSNIGYSHGVPKLLDFGLAHLLEQASSLESRGPDSSDGSPPEADQTGTVSRSRPFIGTPLYLSPEASKGRHPTEMFDLWSLHVLLIEAITGRHPFRGATIEDTVRRIRGADLGDAWTARPVPPSLTAYFARALAQDPKERVRNASEVVEALRTLPFER